MEKQQPDGDLETKISTLLQINQCDGLSSDTEFLQKLNRNLSLLEQSQSSPVPHRIWFNGLCNGLAAAVLGVIIFVGLQVLPQWLVNTSLAGTGLMKGKIIETALHQNVLWQKAVIDLRQFLSI